MRFFLKSRKFKIMVAIASVILVLSIVLSFVVGAISPVSGLFGAITAPAQKIWTNVGQSISDFFIKLNDAESIMLKNAELKEQISELNSNLVDYDKIKQENEFYKNYLGLKDDNLDFELEPASLISKNADDPYGSFLIDKGSLHGISQYDPVITSAGVVGYIGEVSSSYSKVTTILDISLNCGAFDSRTQDVGVVSGNLQNAKQNKTRIKNLSRTSSVAVGDMIVTSGGGVFPDGLIIGTLESLHREDYTSGIYGVIAPAANLNDIRDVMVITYFAGQGSVIKSGE